MDLDCLTWGAPHPKLLTSPAFPYSQLPALSPYTPHLPPFYLQAPAQHSGAPGWALGTGLG